MNKAMLVGRVTKPIELRHTQSGTAIVRFSLAVNRLKKDDGADFVNCVAYAKLADLMDQYVKKGDRLGVVGRIQTGSYEKDGRKIYTTDVIVENLEFLNNKSSDENDAEVAPTEDLPF